MSLAEMAEMAEMVAMVAMEHKVIAVELVTEDMADQPEAEAKLEMVEMVAM